MLRPEQTQAPHLVERAPPGAGGNCESCGLSLNIFGAYEMPPLTGRYCSILCIEYELFGRFRCNWCGSKTASSHSRNFCNESCQQTCARAERQGVRFGDGTRLSLWMSEKRLRKCLQCGGSLDGKRADAEFCRQACRKAYLRENQENA